MTEKLSKEVLDNVRANYFEIKENIARADLSVPIFQKIIVLFLLTFRFPADTYSDIINIGLPSLRGRAGGEAVTAGYYHPNAFAELSQRPLLLRSCSSTSRAKPLPPDAGET